MTFPFYDYDSDFFSTEDLLFLAGASGKAVEDTATGNPLTFTTDLARPLKSLLIPLTPVQSGTGDPSPQNVRPIVPWDGLSVWNGGKNLFDISTVVKGTLDGTGALVANDNRRTSAYITLGAGKYKLSRNALVDWWKAWAYKLDGTPISKLFDGNGYEVTLTLTELCMIRISFDYVVTAENEVQLEAGSTATAYEPFEPITETDISFPSPVYGGTLDVVSGVLTVEWASYTVNGSESMSLGSYSGTGGIRINTSVIDYLNPEYNLAISDIAIKYQTVPTVIDSLGFRIGSGSSVLAFFVPHSMFDGEATVEKFKEWLASHNMTICTKLATPQEITLTPQQITALVGDNTIWSDADGSMTAVFQKGVTV